MIAADRDKGGRHGHRGLQRVHSDPLEPVTRSWCHTNVEILSAASRTPVSLDFESFYLREFPTIVRLAHLLTSSMEAAEDLAQESFVRVHRRFESLDNPGAYLRVSIVNSCKNWQRGRGRESARHLRLVAGVPTTTPGPDDRDPLLDAVGRLPFRQQVVLVARYWLDLSEGEIAATLNCRPGTVKSLASRALGALREELREELR
jgi:RNA polymerase sigma factor (sigma-70 family)